MNFIECIKLAVSCIWQNKMRSILTMLGIIIGIASVVAVVAVMQGGQADINKSFDKFGSNRVVIQINWREQDKITIKDYFTETDIKAIRNIGDDIIAISPIDNYYGKGKVDKKNENIMISGVSHEQSEIENIELVSGRFISQNDYITKKYVVVIDEKLAKKLYDRTDVVGMQFDVIMRGTTNTVTICGVIKGVDSSLGSAIMEGGYSTVYMPLTTVNKIFYNNYLYAINLKVSDSNQINDIGNKVVDLLHRRHRNEDKYTMQSLNQAIEEFNKVTSTFTFIIAIIAGISLFVGGIGIMNIMLVSVTERTREIGIRKSLGASKENILVQFLIEAIIISIIGGILGMLTGVSIAYLISLVAKWPPIFSIVHIMVAFFITTIIGIIFGVYPAYKAAQLDPIEALRYE